MFGDLFNQVELSFIFISAVLFLGGIYLAPSAVDRDIRFLLAYPRWMARLMERYFKTRWGFLIIFLLIFTLNNISLFTGFISGYFIIFPALFAFFTGFHVAVIGYDMMGWKGIWHMLVNPVAWLEFPAAWISTSLGFRLALTVLTEHSYSAATQTFRELFPLYQKYVMTLLFLAALLEAALIRFADSMQNK